MPKKPRLLLFDAVAIVAAFRAGVWERLVTGYEVVVSSVVMDEAHFYEDAESRRHPVDPCRDGGRGDDPGLRDERDGGG